MDKEWYGWKQKEENKWNGYEAEKNKIRVRQMKGEMLNYEVEIQKVIERLGL